MEYINLRPKDVFCSINTVYTVASTHNGSYRTHIVICYFKICYNLKWWPMKWQH